MDQVIIVIPVYKTIPNLSESISIQQCFKILPNYPVAFIHPKKLDTTNYQNLARNANISFHLEEFEPAYFKDVHGYNNLLLSTTVYKRFATYKYILIYQLDCFVFRDELSVWCAKDYDYIGAPWIKYNKTKNTYEFDGVGNGGFSLRKVSSHLRALRTYRPLYPVNELMEWYKAFNITGKITRFPQLLLKLLGLQDNIWTPLNRFSENEDFFWGYYVPKACRWFRVPYEMEAMKFGFEEAPAYLYELNDQQLPFGCHAWEKYDPGFWRPFIKTNQPLEAI
jgi:hypothetical protein